MMKLLIMILLEKILLILKIQLVIKQIKMKIKQILKLIVRMIQKKILHQHQLKMLNFMHQNNKINLLKITIKQIKKRTLLQKVKK